ncbi:MAG: TetR/AcrR family transcriptional regulator [Hyphomonadaceae bacterium JAD_PAG50586_4]|nr:MAG: TetR/AcrR family transcriptional regulator [Hyphomonadaceae bacterium JAD_PAG50586_4]
MDVKVLSKGEATRERLLDLAEKAVLQKGFGATTIEELIAAAGLTKSGFFYHFRDKNDLAQALLRRYIQRHNDIIDDMFVRSAELTDDPLQGFLIGLKFFADMLADLPNTHPGCIVASFCYQDQQFSRDIRDLNGDGIRAWRAQIHVRLEEIAKRYPPRAGVEIEALADMCTAIVEGGIILSRTLDEKQMLARQVMAYRNYVKLAFEARVEA